MSMRIGITAKLFLVILLTSVIVVVLMLTATRYSLHHGFLGYLSAQEEQRMASVVPRLAAAYEQYGNWDFVRNQPRYWFTLIRPDGMPTDGELARRPHPLPESELTGVAMRFSLLDADKKLVIGNPNLGKASLQAVEVDGKTVGWIALMPFEQVIPGAAHNFQQQQIRAGWVIAALAILLAATAAWFLARVFLSPLKSIAQSTHRLAAGDYSTRVKVAASDEIGALAEDFNQLSLQLEKNEHLRRDFMADIAHELRTPIAILKGELEAIEDSIRPLSMHSIRSLQSEVATLHKLIEDLYQLSLSDVGALAYRKNRQDVIDILARAVDVYQERFAEKGIGLSWQIETGQHIECDVDPHRLQQLFMNLLENSLRYTDCNGQLRIGIVCENAMLHIDFQDSAPGVDAEKLPRLFERFYRTDRSRSRASGGSGLGLAISRNIAQAHQGTLEANNSPLGGLWIRLTLPVTVSP